MSAIFKSGERVRIVSTDEPSLFGREAVVVAQGEAIGEHDNVALDKEDDVLIELEPDGSYPLLIGADKIVHLEGKEL